MSLHGRPRSMSRVEHLHPADGAPPTWVRVECVEPLLEAGRTPAKAIVGEHVRVRARAWRHGSATVNVALVASGPDSAVQRVPMAERPGEPDEFATTFVPPLSGHWTLQVVAETNGADCARGASATWPLRVDPPRAAVGAWYTLFPRSTGGWDEAGEPVHGTFATAIDALPRIARMGFDVVHLAPLHPIGRLRRKGRDDAPVAGPGDPGCPWAVGAEEGGHDAVHPALGDLADFRAFLAAARGLGMDVALELVTHCAPDHPWVTEHPAWFGTVSDGAHEPTEQAVRAWTDIVPLRFDSPDPRVREELYLAVRSVIEFWVGQGVQLFRADNPHTKPVTFWERLLADLKSAHPDVVLLAEAFTRPVVQRGLSRLGFCQSLTYFMWRTDKHELVEFVQELVSGGDTLRPNLFPANHDVIPENLQGVPTSAFAIRAALAALISPAWGISSGYEICEGTSAGPGSQRWRHSEKYELRPRDWESARRDGRSIEDWLRTLNQVRARHPALRQLRTLRLHPVDHADLVAFSKQDPATGDVVLCVVSLDPHGPVSARLEPPVELPEAPGGWWRDEVTGRRWDLSRPWEVRLDPAVQVAAVLVPAPDGAPPADPTGRGPA